jgi:uncharacterized protein YajQ (UPF0234 family)
MKKEVMTEEQYEYYCDILDNLEMDGEEYKRILKIIPDEIKMLQAQIQANVSRYMPHP